MALHEVLRERLAGFELRGAPGRTEHAPAFGLESIGKAAAERRFGPDDGQIDSLAIDEPNHGVGVQYVDRRGGEVRAMPALPGAQMTWVTSGSCESFQARACSRAPEPRTRIRMAY